jgi:hypothetical protein
MRWGRTCRQRPAKPDGISIGDRRSGISAATTLYGLSMRVNILVFQRGRVAVILLHFYSPHITPGATIQELGALLDRRARHALANP